jgi:hypothetical protein
VFGTALDYVVLRLSGVGPDDSPMMTRIRACQTSGRAVQSTSRNSRFVSVYAFAHSPV